MSFTHLHWFKEMLGNKELVDRLKKITLVITDVDGSLTDGTVHYDATGEADRILRKMVLLFAWLLKTALTFLFLVAMLEHPLFLVQRSYKFLKSL